MKIVRQLMLLTFAAAVFAGCTQTPPQEPEPGNNVQTQETAPDSTNNMDRNGVTAHLENIVKSLPQVEDAHCVVFGNTAIVGINVQPGLDRARVDSIKYSAAEALKKDKYGVNSLVTADLDLDQRIREIRDDINNGRPLAGFAEELGDIIGRIMPQIPRDINPVDQPPTPQNNEPNQ